MKRLTILTALCFFLIVPGLRANEPDPLVAGPLPDGGHAIATWQLLHPAGDSVQFNFRPLNMILSHDGGTLYVKTDKALVLIDTEKWVVKQETSIRESRGSAHGIALTRDGTKLYTTSPYNYLLEVTFGPDGLANWNRNIYIPGPSYQRDTPANVCGIALSKDEKTAYVCLSRNNTLGIVDLEAGTLKSEIPVGVAPFDVVLSPDGRTAYVSNWGGRHPGRDERAGVSSGTRVSVDERGVVDSGTVSIVDIKKGKEIKEIAVELHPSDLEITKNGRAVLCANANSDTVSVIDTKSRKVVETILVRPDPTLPFGSASNAIKLSPDEKTLYVANGGNNAVAVVSLRGPRGKESTIRGFIPTAWYPDAVLTDGENLYIANARGYGLRILTTEEPAMPWNVKPAYGNRSQFGTVQKVAIPSDEQLDMYTAQVMADARVPQMLLSMEKAESDRKPVPVPENVGEPSVFEHVVYIIKENKTYDQIFGDMERGNSDPELCIYPRNVTPNHHAIADQFVLLDNYYCNGVNSGDGQQWVAQGACSDYYEKAFGGFTRSYGGDSGDPLVVCSSGFIWDDVLLHGISFRNYGFSDRSGIPDGISWKTIYDDFMSGDRVISFAQKIGNDTLRRYSARDYPGWSMIIPDVLRADEFLKEFREYEKNGGWPNFVIIFLPNDHTSGGKPGYPTIYAQMADNDLALGQIVEAISESRFWPKTCIFVEEDDPQSGFDHVDGHRSICLVMSPYTKRGEVVSNFYNQGSVLRTMEHMLGTHPMNQFDAMAPLMTECFTETPDFSPYKCLPNNIPLDDITVTKTAGIFYKRDINLARDVDDFSGPDMVDDDELNRVIWALAKGPDVPYPAHLAGAHGSGLADLNLVLTGDDDD